MTVEIKWSADSDGVFVAKEHTTLLPGSWADCEGNAESAAKKICEDFFDCDIWDEWIGYDETRWTVNLEIHAPPSIAGHYEVELERVTKASATKLEPAERQ